MSGLKHETVAGHRILGSRPTIITPEACEGLVGAGETYERPCTINAHWLVPEVNYCAIHMPTEWLPILHRRALAWIDGLEDLWLTVVHDEHQGRHEIAKT